MSLPSKTAETLANVIRRLSSDSDGEIIAAMHAILRLLESCGGDIHTLAARVENGRGLTEDDKQKIKNEIENARAWLRRGRASGGDEIPSRWPAPIQRGGAIRGAPDKSPAF